MAWEQIARLTKVKPGRPRLVDAAISNSLLRAPVLFCEDKTK